MCYLGWHNSDRQGGNGSCIIFAVYMWAIPVADMLGCTACLAQLWATQTWSTLTNWDWTAHSTWLPFSFQSDTDKCICQGRMPGYKTTCHNKPFFLFSFVEWIYPSWSATYLCSVVWPPPVGFCHIQLIGPFCLSGGGFCCTGSFQMRRRTFVYGARPANTD